MVGSPIIQLWSGDPLNDEAHLRGTVYSVASLIQQSKDLPVFQCPLAALDLSYIIWSKHNMLDLAAEIARVNKADISHPILLNWDGGLLDGRHRILRALVDGVSELPARRFTAEPNYARKIDD